MIGVSGGAGYIGSVVVEKLCDAGHAVVVYDNLVDGHEEAVDERARLVRESIGSTDLNGVDTIIHLAASANVPESIADPKLYYYNNVEQTRQLLDNMVEVGVKKIIFASTAAIDSNTPYGNSKRACEDMIRDYSKAYGIEYCIFRFFCVVGATEKHGESRKHETHLIPVILDVALGKKDKVEVYGDDYFLPNGLMMDGTAIRDYIHVEDIADAILLALPFDKGYDNFFELGTDGGYSVLDVIKQAETEIGITIPYEIRPRRQGDVGWLVSNSWRAKKILGWEPRKSLRDIISSAYNWRKNPLY